MTDWREARLRAELVAAGATLARQGLIRGREGNLSTRLDSETVLLTPRGWDKGRLTGPCMVRSRIGAPPPAEASSEGWAHLEVYRKLPDVAALVHAHPMATITATGFGLRLDLRRLPEAEQLLGGIELVPGFRPGSRDLAEACVDALRRAPVVVLSRHGALAAGATVAEALVRIETLELLARVTLAERG
jgi:L-fuculose-phosphate aldolase